MIRLKEEKTFLADAKLIAIGSILKVFNRNNGQGIGCFFFGNLFFIKFKGYTTIIKKDNKDRQINEEIRDKEVRLIGANGEQHGIVSSREALRIAEEEGLDLVKISPNAVPPVCKVMDYGKFLFEQTKKAKEAKKNQKVVEIKEIWLSMTIDVGDINVKAKQTNKFLASGNKVKVSIKMRGRQQAHPELAMDVMTRFTELVKENGTVEKQPLKEGRNIWMMLAPIKA